MIQLKGGRNSMYITKENIKTLRELIAFVDGQLDAVEDIEYWDDLLHRTVKIKDKAGKYSVETMTGDIITDLAYEDTYAGYDHLVGKLVTVAYGTCGGACELGKPDENCIKNKAYSKNKCAVILVEKLDVAEHVINLTFENLLKITENK